MKTRLIMVITVIAWTWPWALGSQGNKLSTLGVPCLAFSTRLQSQPAAQLWHPILCLKDRLPGQPAIPPTSPECPRIGLGVRLPNRLADHPGCTRHLGLCLRCWASRSTRCPSGVPRIWPLAPGCQVAQLSILDIPDLAFGAGLPSWLAIYLEHPGFGLTCCAAK